jgi:Kef-type K+ transport system membrane component KefB/voltage-gated potassium channel Kch
MPELTALLHASPFYELAALLALAAAVACLGGLLRQPIVVSFIAVGILAGPSGLDLVHSHQQIELLAQLGIAVLLFLVGLKLDLQLLRSLGAVSLATGLGQVAFTAGFGFLLALWLGMAPVPALYVAVALTFSSTIIIVKLLSDKRELEALHGRIAVGFLIVQDVVVVIAMLALSSFGVGSASDADPGAAFTGIIIKALLMGGAVLIFARYAAGPVTRLVARSQELLVTFAIAWAVLLAALGSYLGFSKELGGLLAGVSLASTPVRDAISARLATLRDFLLLFFFIGLGSQLQLGLLGEQLLPALVLSVFVLVGNPLIVMVILGWMGYRSRTGFLAGLTVAQISEFSLIFMAMGVTLGHVGQGDLGLVTLVGLVTIALSVYMITYSHSLYRWLERWLRLFERAKPSRELAGSSVYAPAADTLLIGLGRFGDAIFQRLRAGGREVLGVDFNPALVERARSAGLPVRFGDATDPEFLAHLPLEKIDWVIAALPQHETGLTHEDPRQVLLATFRAQGYRGKVAVCTYDPTEAETLRAAGATVVFSPHADAAACAAAIVLGTASATASDGGEADLAAAP